MKFYANNSYRKSLTKEEKKRYNAYKKRECERRRRYRRKGNMKHICFHSYRCEVCKHFYEQEKKIELWFGFSICRTCLIDTHRTIQFFIRVKFDYTPHKETLEDVACSLQNLVDDTDNGYTPQFQSKKKGNKKVPIEEKKRIDLSENDKELFAKFLWVELECQKIRLHQTYYLMYDYDNHFPLGQHYCVSWINNK